MSRRGQSKKRELKRTKKSVKKQLDSLHGSYIPDRAHCRTRQWDTAYDDVNTVRVQFNTWHRGRQLIDFVILVQRPAASFDAQLSVISPLCGTPSVHPGGYR